MVSFAVDTSPFDRAAALPTIEQPTDTSATAFSCMIVTTQDTRRDNFVAGAENAGWRVIRRATPRDAVQQSRTAAPQLLIVDLVGNESPEDSRALLESVSQRDGTLLLVCGNEGDAMEEIWARSLGVWLYLPGIPDDADFSEPFSEALKITKPNADVRAA